MGAPELLWSCSRLVKGLDLSQPSALHVPRTSLVREQTPDYSIDANGLGLPLVTRNSTRGDPPRGRLPANRSRAIFTCESGAEFPGRHVRVAECEHSAWRSREICARVFALVEARNPGNRSQRWGASARGYEKECPPTSLDLRANVPLGQAVSRG